MAVTTTPLGFKKPDGNELVRGGDNHIADNAQKADDVITATNNAIATVSGRVSYVEASLAAGAEPGDGSSLTPDPDNPGLYFIV